MRLALDAMGSDRAPAVEVEGAVGALSDHPDLGIIFVGDRPAIEAELAKHPGVPRDRYEIVHTTQVIDPGEPPAQAFRRKPHSSIVVGIKLLKKGIVDAFLSAGSTGAVMAGSVLTLRPLPGVDRPAVGAAIPTESGRCFLIDAGANVDTRPQHLVQFAHLGTIYAQDLMNLENPRVGLLNIGEEPEKGNEQSVETHQLLSTAPRLNFIGNVEGRDVVRGACDVLVCDGFVGNVLLKFYESMGEFFSRTIRRVFEEAAAQTELLERVYARLDWTTTGGALLLGVNGSVVICHGGSPPNAIRNAVGLAVRAAERGVAAHIAGRLDRLAEPQEAE
ncbi:MAG TPA: phosphate acyltransferase PlsX [Longimicrobiaceae bacterium]|nr:phosphate acyltransferase PlsX [Longimicrobiaceae bacterium]